MHVKRQRDYHVCKADRLTKVHENLDRLSGLFFLLAVSREQTILVVEDEASVRLAISDYLTEQGFTVLQAADASGAIDVIARHPEIELVFTDLAMPGDLDGLDLVDWLLKRHPGLPVIVASGLRGRVSTMAEYSNKQALSYFVKPSRMTPWSKKFAR